MGIFFWARYNLTVIIREAMLSIKSKFAIILFVSSLLSACTTSGKKATTSQASGINTYTNIPNERTSLELPSNYHMYKDNNFIIGIVKHIAQSNDGAIYASTPSGIYSNTKGSFSLEDQFPREIINDFDIGPDGMIYFVSDFSLYYGKPGSFIRDKSVSGTGSLLKVAKDGTIYVVENDKFYSGKPGSWVAEQNIKSVNSVAEGDDGTVYLGTDSGIYSGKPGSFVKDSTISEGVNAISIGSKGIIYIASQNGIYSGKPGQFHMQDESLKNMKSIVEASDGTIYATNSLELFSGKLGAVKRNTSLTKSKQQRSGQSYKDKNGIIYIPAADGIYSNKLGSISLEKPSSEIPFRISAGQDGKILLGTSNGLYSGKPSALEKVPGLNMSVVTAAEGTDGTFYIGVDHGFYYGKPGSFVQEKSITKRVFSIAVNSMNTIYFATIDGHFYSGKPGSFLENTNAPKGITAVSIAKNGTVYVATAENGFYILKSGFFIKEKDGITDVLNSLSFGNEGFLSAGNFSGIYSGKLGAFKFEEIPYALVASSAMTPDGTLYVILNFNSIFYKHAILPQ